MNLFRYAWYAGAAVILISMTLLASGPHKAVSMPDGFLTPVIAFEFIESRAEVLDLFGHTSSRERDELIAAMNRTNMIDFLYMAAYTLFLVLLSSACLANRGSKWFILPACIALIVLAADVAENIQLLAIAAHFDKTDVSHELEMLHIFTWIKWGGLSAVFLALTPFMINGEIYGRIIISLSICTAITGMIAFFHRSVMNEVFALLAALTFIMLIVFSFTRREIKK